MAARNEPQAELSRRFQPAGLGEDEIVEAFEATPGERAALAERFDLLALDFLSAVLRLRRLEGGPIVRVEGRFEAEVTQSCVVTLEPFPSRLEQDFCLLYSLDPCQAAAEPAIQVDIEQEDPPEPVPPGGIDLGEVVAEQLAVVLDPYPRAAGARLERAEWDGGDEGQDNSDPFAVLRSLKGKE